jgi:hypothetical protein
MPGVNSPKAPIENTPVFVMPGLPGYALEGSAANRLTDAAPVGGREGALREKIRYFCRSLC